MIKLIPVNSSIPKLEIDTTTLEEIQRKGTVVIGGKQFKIYADAESVENKSQRLLFVTDNGQYISSIPVDGYERPPVEELDTDEYD